jgi:hypothetical protein
MKKHFNFVGASPYDPNNGNNFNNGVVGTSPYPVKLEGSQVTK